MIPVKPPRKLKDGETATYAVNPYYDDVLVFADIEIPTSQDDFKLFDSEKNLYQRVEKPNVRKFREQIKERLLAKKKDWWPFQGNVSVSISISGPKRYIDTRDLDNFLKTIFDSIKGIVIIDDHKIVRVSVDKDEISFVSGLLIAIRNESESEEYIYGQDQDNWEADRRLKVSRGGICCMDSY